VIAHILKARLMKELPEVGDILIHVEPAGED
jgi:divalent metal cation (Fe/Co/Zn/Cd) transporter